MVDQLVYISRYFNDYEHCCALERPESFHPMQLFTFSLHRKHAQNASKHPISQMRCNNKSETEIDSAFHQISAIDRELYLFRNRMIQSPSARIMRGYCV